jgi:hypothetical protein
MIADAINREPQDGPSVRSHCGNFRDKNSLYGSRATVRHKASLLLIAGLTVVWLPTAPTAARADTPTTEWKPSAQHLYDLVKASYTIVAVSAGFPQAGQTLYIFYLQKNDSVFRCFNFEAGAHSSFTCEELTLPYNAH